MIPNKRLSTETLKWKLFVIASFKNISFVLIGEDLGMTAFHNGPVVFNEINGILRVSSGDLDRNVESTSCPPSLALR